MKWKMEEPEMKLDPINGGPSWRVSASPKNPNGSVWAFGASAEEAKQSLKNCVEQFDKDATWEDEPPRKDLFQRGDFTLNSGAKSSWKIECDSLTDGDINALAVMVRQMVGPVREVHGVPRGGVPLANAVARLGIDPYGKILVVEDVVTTGGSIARYRDKLMQDDPGRFQSDFVGAVIFARGKCPSWVKAVFQMPECFWINPGAR